MTSFGFQPSTTAPFQFQPTLDGALYLATVLWNTYGQRWYLQLTDGAGNMVFFQPLVPSQVGVQVASASWDFNAQRVDVETQGPHGYPVGLTVDLTLSGMVPITYDGKFQCFVTSATGLQYSADTNPGILTATGTVSYDVDMAAGYFETSTLVWRQANNTFEVNP